MHRKVLAKELLRIAEELLEAFKKRTKPRKPQRGQKKKTDQKYYKKNKKNIRKQQKKYYKKNKKFLT